MSRMSKTPPKPAKSTPRVQTRRTFSATSSLDKAKIKVGNATYTIKIVPYKDAMSINNFMGRCVPGDATIELSDQLHDDQLKTTLLHELLHALYFYRCMYNIKHIPDSEREEFVVDNLSNALSSLFKDNPGLAKYIFS